MGEDNGFVVYDVTVAGPKGPVDVTVDAGSGAVLAKETDANDANEGPETADANEGATGPASAPATTG